MWEWPRSGINRAAHDLPAERPDGTFAPGAASSTVRVRSPRRAEPVRRTASTAGQASTQLAAIARRDGVEKRSLLQPHPLPRHKLPGRVQNPCPQPTSHNQRCHTVLRPSPAWATSLATPGSPPPTSSRTCRSTPSPRPAATRCSPRPPAAPAPPAPSSTRFWTSYARRQPGRVEAGPAGPVWNGRIGGST
jgi:hypothetical protein